jgi:hypothetical protein
VPLRVTLPSPSFRSSLRDSLPRLRRRSELPCGGYREISQLAAPITGKRSSWLQEARERGYASLVLSGRDRETDTESPRPLDIECTSGIRYLADDLARIS